MSVKSRGRWVLLLFVAYSVVMVGAKRFVGPAGQEVAPEGVAAAAPAAADGPADQPGTPALAANRLVVYYFHGRERCENCRNLQAYAHEAVHAAFGHQIAAGVMAWQVVDFSQPKDAHFDKDFKLGGISSVVLVEIRDGKPARWKNLEDGLMLAVTGTKAEVIEYVQREVRAFREGK